MSIFDIFKSKKPTVANNSFNLFSSTLTFSSVNATRIEDSDIAEICIDRIATHISKLRPKHIKNATGGAVEVLNDEINFRLTHCPNEMMTTAEFIYKVISLLLLNNNAFIYLTYGQNGKISGLYPLNPLKVEIKQDLNNSLFLEMDFGEGENYTLPYETMIHLKRLYKKHEIFGGDGAVSNHKQLLKNIQTNESLITGLENAIKSSFQIKGLLKMNAMLSEKDKQRQKELFDEGLKNSTSRNGSSIVPIDLKSDYIPLSTDPKLIDKDTLNFVQNKILNYFGVSEGILNSTYDENEYNAFYENTLEPLTIFLSNAFSKSLLSRAELQEGEQIMFYGERLNYASWASKITAIEKLMGLGIFSINESRGVLGYPPIEDGNKRIQSLNFVNAKLADEYQIGKEQEEETNE